MILGPPRRGLWRTLAMTVAAIVDEPEALGGTAVTRAPSFETISQRAEKRI